MELRPELLPPNQGLQHIQDILDLLHPIVSRVDSGVPADAEIAAFNSATGLDYGRQDFHEIDGYMNIEDFARIAAAGRPPKLGNITDAEYIEIIRRLCKAEANVAETHFWLRLLQINLGCLDISDLIYFPTRDMAPGEILQEARSRRSIINL